MFWIERETDVNSSLVSGFYISLVVPLPGHDNTGPVHTLIEPLQASKAHTVQRHYKNPQEWRFQIHSTRYNSAAMKTVSTIHKWVIAFAEFE